MCSLHFADRLAGAIEETGSVLLMGLDPRPRWLPESIVGENRKTSSRKEAARQVRRFDSQLIDLASDRLPAIKVQIAFYEALGIEGLKTFRHTIRRASEAGLLVIVDAKRGDIGSTARAYSNAFLGFPGSGPDDQLCSVDPAFPGDALTVQPYFGFDGLEPFLDAAEGTGNGVFVLVKTSNPGASDFQELEADGRPVYEAVAERLVSLTAKDRGECGYASTGAVVGATQPEALNKLRDLLDSHFLLTPGLGAQGGSAEALSGLVDDRGLGCLVPMARSIIYSYRDAPGEHWKDVVNRTIDDWNETLRSQFGL